MRLLKPITDVSEARMVERSANMLSSLYKMFTTPEKQRKAGRNPNSKQEMVPLDGLFSDFYNNRRQSVATIDRFPTLAEVNKQELMLEQQEAMKEQQAAMKPMKDMTDVKDTKEKDEPQFWLFDKFSKKTDLLLMTKILLKLIVFKKIVKFIALVCLLFFIPAIQDNSSKEMEEKEKESRNFNIYGS